MNKRIESLLADRDGLKLKTQAQINEINSKLSLEYDKVFSNDKALIAALNNLGVASEYGLDQYGEIYLWFRYAGLSDVPEHTREFLEEFVSNYNGANIDWDNDCFTLNEGESIVIQDDTRNDNGVWLSGKLIIEESEYKDDDGEVNEAKRNSLIEAYMECTGYFPGVFRVTSYGDVFPVNTQTKQSA
jgi:hypothetical protein